MRALDRWAARHKIIATIAAAAIVFTCLYLASEIDQSNDVAIRWQMVASNRT